MARHVALRLVLERYQDVVHGLRKEGVVVNQNARPAFSFADAHQAFVSLLLSLKSPGMSLDEFHHLAVQAGQFASDDDSIFAGFARGMTLRHRDWTILNESRLKMRAAWRNFFSDYDILLCPVAPTAAIPHDHSEPLIGRVIQVNDKSQPYVNLMSWGGIIGVTHLPATVAPVGSTKAGLPFGIQIVGPYLEDHTPIAFARHLADVVGGFQVPPGY